MSLPFRIRRAEWVAGALLMLSVVALVASLVLLSRARGSFESTVTYYAVLEEGYGITPGGRVEMLGIDIGHIESLEITDENKVQARVEIRERFAERLLEDSRARVKASLDLQGVLGGVGLAVSAGTPGKQRLEPGSTIIVDEPRTVADLLPMVEGDPLIQDIEALVHNARRMSDEVADPNSPLQQALVQATALLTKVQDKESTIGRILQDDGQMYARLVGTLDSVEKSLERLDKVLAKSGTLIRSADGMVDRGGTLMDKAGGLMDDSTKVVGGIGPVLDTTDEAMKELNEAVKAFADTTAELKTVVEAMGPLVENMDDMVRNMDEVAEATKKVWPIRKHARRSEKRD